MKTLLLISFCAFAIVACGEAPTFEDASDGGTETSDGGCVPACEEGLACSSGTCVNLCGTARTGWRCDPDLRGAARCDQSRAIWRLETRDCEARDVCNIDENGEPQCGACVLGTERCARDGRSIERCIGGDFASFEHCELAESCSTDVRGTPECRCNFNASYCVADDVVATCASGASSQARCHANASCSAVHGLAAGCFTEGDIVTNVTGSVVVRIPEDVVVFEGVHMFAPSRATALAMRGTKLLGAAPLDESGRFSIPVRDANGGAFDVFVAAVSRDSAGKERVRITEDALPTTAWRMKLATVDAIAEMTDVGEHIVDDFDGTSRLYMLEWIADALGWTDVVFGRSERSVTVDTNSGGSFHWGSAPRHPAGESSTHIAIAFDGRFETTVLIHELGHHVANQYGGDVSGSLEAHESHVTGDLAWSEAFASVYAQVYVNEQRGVTSSLYQYDGYGREPSSLYLREDFETRVVHTSDEWLSDPDGTMDQLTNEWVVAEILWDLIDDTPDEDAAHLDFADVLAAIALPVSDRGARNYDLVDHLDALVCSGTLDAALAEDVSRANSFPYTSPSACE